MEGMQDRPDEDDARPRRMARRALLGGTVAAGWAALAAGGRVRAQGDGSDDDVALLNDLLALEHLLFALYRDGLVTFDAAAFRAADWPRTLRLDLELVRDAEEAHAAALADLVAERDGAPVEPGEYAWSYEELDGFLQLAATLENAAVAAYAGAIPLLTDGDAGATLLGLHSVEARHATYLSDRIGLAPFPDVIDQPIGRDDLAAITAPYMAGAAPANGPTEPAAPATEPEQPEEPVSRPPSDAEGPDLDPIVADAAQRLGIAPEEVAVVTVEARDWPSSALGCPQPGMFYLQVITPGYLVLLEGAGRRLEYHTDERGTFVLCKEG